MTTRKKSWLITGIALGILLFGTSCGYKASDAKPVAKNDSSAVITLDPLPSWNEGNIKKAIIDFVKAVTTEGSSSFVKPGDRIATEHVTKGDRG